LIVNGQKVDTPGAPKRFRGQQTYIPKMVSLESQIGARARNLLRFFSHQGDRAFIAILLVSPRGVEQASREMSAVEDEAANLAWGRGLLNPQGDDDEVEVVSGAVALRDPLSMAKIATPVRGKLCQHFACFDLQTYLDYNAQHDSWECPVCRAALAPSQVQVCREFQKVLEASQEDDDFAPMLPRADEGSPVGPDKSDDAVQKNGPADTLNGTGLWEDLPKARELYLNPDLALQNLEDSMVGRRRRKRADRGGALCRKSDANDMGESEDSDARSRRRKRVARGNSGSSDMSVSEDSDARSRRHHGGASRAQCISGDMSVSEDSHDELERTLRRRRLIIENSSDSEAGERGAAGKQAVDASEDRRTTIMYSSGSD
tara:strand:+ start:2019 stop:3140 length:1122 start_codon:yes stop_codon:yes gene_type:complete